MTYDAILVGGLDYPPYYPLNKQLEFFKGLKFPPGYPYSSKGGFGQNKNVQAYRYSEPTSTIISFLQKNPKIPIFLFSAGCNKAYELAINNYVDPKKIYIIEPYAASSRVSGVVQKAVSVGVPAANVFTGSGSARGSGVVQGATKSGNVDHWGSLVLAGQLNSNQITSSTPPENITTPMTNKAGVVTANSPTQDEIGDINAIQNFQTWLDQKKPGWATGYPGGKLNRGKGFGVFGPRTKKAWGLYKDEYLKK